ncbi:TFIIB-type zinc ribbon-containing protein [Pyxidicoccus xibeiensis]|uniref:TFIIB-type zinc ribbon-containing protein n=1 Tax=Pyxidicoccus xibeiensis TaxID=2906759 RepID=UPI0020A6FAD3|nr:zf-TFIIB domain-containing protein [Pyxidicoccus xibeiensis]MCP3135951.1 zf-TFIIB domain-containing protein [Pyxidicoccus xibeiensis]
MSRPCPICQTKTNTTLRTTRVHGVQVDTCDTCKGHWLEHGELERLTSAWKSEALWDALAQAPRRCPHSRHHVAADRTHCGLCGAQTVGCPTCGERLSQVRMEVCAVDVCGQCHGLWLDANELTLLSRAPKSSLRPLVGGVAVAAATAAALAASQAAAGGPDPVRSQLRDSGLEVVGAVTETAVEVVAEVTLEVIVDNAGTVVDVVVDGASTVGSAVGEAMGVVLAGLFEIFS